MKSLSEEKPNIPKKPKPASETSELKTKAIESNGVISDPPSNTTLKRPLDDGIESEGADSKKRKLGDAGSRKDEVVDVDDDGSKDAENNGAKGAESNGDGGAIVIDDD